MKIELGDIRSWYKSGMALISDNYAYFRIHSTCKTKTKSEVCDRYMVTHR